MNKWRCLWEGVLRGTLAALFWLAGFVAAFPMWRFTFYFGVCPLAIGMGAGVGKWLCPENWETWGVGVATAVALSVLLLVLLWDMPWFNELILVLYQGFHVTEAGFAGLLTIVLYVPLSALSALIFSFPALK